MKLQRGQTLVATMIVLVIICILAVALFGRNGGDTGPGTARKDNLGNSMPALVKLAAKDDECRNHLDQIRAGVQIYKVSNGDEGNPQSLADIKGIGRDFCTCPVGHETYVYDPNTGKVSCPHPGHEKY